MSWTRTWTVLALGAALVGCAKEIPVPVPGGVDVRFSHPVSVTEAVKLSQAGVDPEVIVYKMNLSGIVYNLDDEQYARIRELGVTPRVIDYMRSTYDQALTRYPKLAKDERLSVVFSANRNTWAARLRSDGITPPQAG